MKNTVVILGLSLMLFSCAHSLQPETTANILQVTSETLPKADSESLSNRERIAELINKSRTEKFSDTMAVNILFATNRTKNKTSTLCSAESFGLNVSPETKYGICRINVPKQHATGKIEYSSEYTTNSNQYFKILSERQLDFESFTKALQTERTNELLIFVHGFNVKFDDAVLRASQLAYDLKFQGHVVLFSWPSGAEDVLGQNVMLSRTYKKNKDNAEKSIQQAIDFFDLISRLNLKVSLYVHSMGHQVVIPALTQLAQNTDIKLLVDELILNAPDFDLKEFNKLAPDLLKLAKHITLYCSYNDQALRAS